MNKTRLLFSLIISFSFAAFLTGCYCRSENAETIELPSEALEDSVDEASNDTLFQITEDWLPEDWWTLFHDEQLNGFMETVLRNNPTLQLARAKIFSALANADRVRAALLPSVYWNSDVQREKLTKTGVFPISGSGSGGSSTPLPAGPFIPGIPVYFTQYETALNILYDFDIWCKNRNTFRSAMGEVQSTVADEAFTRLGLSIAVAETYFQLQINYEQHKIWQDIVNNRENYFQLVQKRVQYNLDDNLIFYQALNDLVSAKQNLLVVEANIILGENQLKAYLANDFLEEIQDVHIEQKPLPKIPLPAEIPMHLLCHRPDVISQLWLIQSAGYKINVAIAGFYPDLNLMTFGGFQTIHLHRLLQAQSSYWDMQILTSLPIFTGGLLEANLWYSEIDYDMAILKYNQLVLDAVREVLDGVAILQNNNRQFEEFKTEVKQQEKIDHLTELRVKHNLASNLEFLNSEQETLVLRNQEVGALGQTVISILELIKALGGGYDACVEKDCIDDCIADCDDCNDCSL